MLYTKTINKALKVAYECHSRQFDKAGIPYIFHPIHVAESCVFEDEILTGLLHDCLEDAADKFQPFYEELCQTHPDVADALKVLNRYGRAYNSYSEYIDTVLTNRLARIVKFYDLKHNLNTDRFDGTGFKSSETALKRYNKALAAIQRFSGELYGTDIMLPLNDYEARVILSKHPYKVTIMRVKQEQDLLNSIYAPLDIELSMIGARECVKPAHLQLNSSSLCYALHSKHNGGFIEFSFEDIVPSRVILVQLRGCELLESEEALKIREVNLKEHLL